MPSLKQLKQAEKTAAEQRRLILEMDALIKDIDRCEKNIGELQRDFSAINAKYPARRTTREDIACLTDLLKCANRKLAWEKQIASLQKRAPAVLETLQRLLNDPQNPPEDATRAEMLRLLQGIQAAMERLQNAKMN